MVLSGRFDALFNHHTTRDDDDDDGMGRNRERRLFAPRPVEIAKRSYQEEAEEEKVHSQSNPLESINKEGTERGVLSVATFCNLFPCEL